MHQTVPYSKLDGSKMTAAFRAEVQKRVLRLVGKNCLADDFYIHLPRKVEMDVIDYGEGKPKLRHITVSRLRYNMNVVGGHGEEYLPELITVFNWEVLINSIEMAKRHEQIKKERDSESVRQGVRGEGKP